MKTPVVSTNWIPGAVGGRLDVASTGGAPGATPEKRNANGLRAVWLGRVPYDP